MARAVVHARRWWWPGPIAACLLAVTLLLAAALLPGLGATAQPAPAARLVMFEEAGCSWCRRWHEEVGVGYPRSEEGRRAPLSRLHISKARTSGLRLAAPVTVTPTFVLVDGDVEVGRITGYPGADFFWGLLAEMLARLGPGPSDRPPERPAREAPRDAGLGGGHQQVAERSDKAS